MKVKYPLTELSEDNFEAMSVSICENILRNGVIPCAKGRDGGKDGRFEGTAQSFPSTVSPLTGRFIIQAKHTSSPIASCSNNDLYYSNK